MAAGVVSGGSGGDGRGDGASIGATAIDAGGGVGDAGGGVGGKGGVGLDRWPRKRKMLGLEDEEEEDERVFPRLTIFTVEVRFA